MIILVTKYDLFVEKGEFNVLLFKDSNLTW